MVLVSGVYLVTCGIGFDPYFCTGRCDAADTRVVTCVYVGTLALKCQAQKPCV